MSRTWIRVVTRILLQRDGTHKREFVRKRVLFVCIRSLNRTVQISLFGKFLSKPCNKFDTFLSNFEVVLHYNIKATN